MGTFKVVRLTRSNGCDISFKSGRYTGTPEGAAKKALSVNCNRKKIRGKCTFYIVLQNTTQDSSVRGRLYEYKVQRVLKDKPVEVKDKKGNLLYVSKYDTQATSVNRIPFNEKCPKSKKNLNRSAKTLPKKYKSLKYKSFRKRKN